MRENDPTVCVVIPYHRIALSAGESIALDRCLSVLRQHPIALAKPESLQPRELLSTHPQLLTEDFSEGYFAGVEGYNRLMLSDEFYARFAAYDYILIHQLDAFVFSDRLAEWCRRGYDYVGAPWLPDGAIPTRCEGIQIYLRRTRARWSKKTGHGTQGMHPEQYMYSVGNGGFSLRRVARMRAMLRSMSALADEYRNGDLAIHHEDMFFCIEANRYLPRVRVPSYRVASDFSWELQPATAKRLNDGKLPFGCHGWNKLHRDEWRSNFATVGYSLDEMLK